VYLFNVAATKIAFWQEIVCLIYVFAVAMSFVMFGNKGLNNEFRQFEVCAKTVNYFISQLSTELMLDWQQLMYFN
jgi:hypothetical protein